MLGTVVCDALMRHCLSDEFELQHEYVIQCQHTFIRKKLMAMHAAASESPHAVDSATAIDDMQAGSGPRQRVFRLRMRTFMTGY